ncbi:hypothetical protein BYT27DRAFT_7263885 [Phlegmacium glaucopus]|nr:hypothetical protein BYT27DRAFT_7263885 [Phlegmacium glaucopus]
MDAAAIFSWKLAIQGHRSRVQGLSLLIWDLLLTFDDEKQLIWRRPYTLPTYLFIWIRYIGISLNAGHDAKLHPVSLVFEISDETSVNPINGFLWLCLEEWLGISLIISIGLILQLRIYALYDKSRKVAAFMIISFVAQIAIGCFILWPGAERGRVIAELVGNISRCKVVYTPKYAFLFWVTLIGFEFILFTLVGYKAFEYYFRPSPRFKERLRYALLQDSIYYTAIICVVYIYNLVNWMRHLVRASS